MKKILFLIASLFLVNSYAANQISPNNIPVYTSPRTPINLKKSQNQFEIQLPSNPTTGFKWFLKKYPKNLVLVKSQKYLAPNSKLMGAGGKQIWLFQLSETAKIAPHSFTIKLIYARPWNMKVSEKAKFTIMTA